MAAADHPEKQNVCSHSGALVVFPRRPIAKSKRWLRPSAYTRPAGKPSEAQDGHSSRQHRHGVAGDSDGEDELEQHQVRVTRILTAGSQGGMSATPIRVVRGGTSAAGRLEPGISTTPSTRRTTMVSVASARSQPPTHKALSKLHPHMPGSSAGQPGSEFVSSSSDSERGSQGDEQYTAARRDGTTQYVSDTSESEEGGQSGSVFGTPGGVRPAPDTMQNHAQDNALGRQYLRQPFAARAQQQPPPVGQEYVLSTSSAGSDGDDDVASVATSAAASSITRSTHRTATSERAAAVPEFTSHLSNLRSYKPRAVRTNVLQLAVRDQPAVSTRSMVSFSSASEVSHGSVDRSRSHSPITPTGQRVVNVRSLQHHSSHYHTSPHSPSSLGETSLNSAGDVMSPSWTEASSVKPARTRLASTEARLAIGSSLSNASSPASPTPHPGYMYNTPPAYQQQHVTPIVTPNTVSASWASSQVQLPAHPSHTLPSVQGSPSMMRGHSQSPPLVTVTVGAQTDPELREMGVQSNLGVSQATSPIHSSPHSPRSDAQTSAQEFPGLQQVPLSVLARGEVGEQQGPHGLLLHVSKGGSLHATPVPLRAASIGPSSSGTPLSAAVVLGSGDASTLASQATELATTGTVQPLSHAPDVSRPRVHSSPATPAAWSATSSGRTVGSSASRSCGRRYAGAASPPPLTYEQRLAQLPGWQLSSGGGAQVMDGSYAPAWHDVHGGQQETGGRDISFLHHVPAAWVASTAAPSPYSTPLEPRSGATSVQHSVAGSAAMAASMGGYLNGKGSPAANAPAESAHHFDAAAVKARLAHALSDNTGIRQTAVVGTGAAGVKVPSFSGFGDPSVRQYMWRPLSGKQPGAGDSVMPARAATTEETPPTAATHADDGAGDQALASAFRRAGGASEAGASSKMAAPLTLQATGSAHGAVSFGGFKDLTVRNHIQQMLMQAPPHGSKAASTQPSLGSRASSQAPESLSSGLGSEALAVTAAVSPAHSQGDGQELDQSPSPMHSLAFRVAGGASEAGAQQMYGSSPPSAIAVSAAAKSGASFGGFQDPLLRQHIQLSLIRGVDLTPTPNRWQTPSPGSVQPPVAAESQATEDSPTIGANTSTDSSPTNAELIHEIRASRGTPAVAAWSHVSAVPINTTLESHAASNSSGSASPEDSSLARRRVGPNSSTLLASRAATAAYQLARSTSTSNASLKEMGMDEESGGGQEVRKPADSLYHSDRINLIFKILQPEATMIPSKT